MDPSQRQTYEEEAAEAAAHQKERMEQQKQEAEAAAAKRRQEAFFQERYMHEMWRQTWPAEVLAQEKETLEKYARRDQEWREQRAAAEAVYEQETLLYPKHGQERMRREHEVRKHKEMAAWNAKMREEGKIQHAEREQQYTEWLQTKKQQEKEEMGRREEQRAEQERRKQEADARHKEYLDNYMREQAERRAQKEAEAKAARTAAMAQGTQCITELIPQLSREPDGSESFLVGLLVQPPRSAAKRIAYVFTLPGQPIPNYLEQSFYFDQCTTNHDGSLNYIFDDACRRCTVRIEVGRHGQIQAFDMFLRRNGDWNYEPVYPDRDPAQVHYCVNPNPREY